MIGILRLSLLLWLVFTAACTPGGPAVIDTDNVHHGDCRIVWQNDVWTANSLQLHHTDPRSCPDSVDPLETVTAGGRVVEPPPGTGGPERDSRRLYLFVHNTGQMCQELGNEVGSDVEDFGWFDFNHDGEFDWTAALWIDYIAGTWDPNRDCPIFEVELFPPQTRAIAHTMVDYTDMDM